MDAVKGLEVSSYVATLSPILPLSSEVLTPCHSRLIQWNGRPASQSAGAFGKGSAVGGYCSSGTYSWTAFLPVTLVKTFCYICKAHFLCCDHEIQPGKFGEIVEQPETVNSVAIQSYKRYFAVFCVPIISQSLLQSVLACQERVQHTRRIRPNKDPSALSSGTNIPSQSMSI